MITTEIAVLHTPMNMIRTLSELLILPFISITFALQGLVLTKVIRVSYGRLIGPL